MSAPPVSGNTTGYKSTDKSQHNNSGWL
jgi:hypothetical protein